MAENTVTLHRVFAAPPEKVFRAFSDPDAIAAWLPPDGFLCKVHPLDFRVGGTFRMPFTNFTTGNGHSFGGESREIVPPARLVYTDQVEDPGLPDVMTVTIELKAVSCGTELRATQAGIPAVIPVEMCYLGWQESMEKLKRLVEPDIPDA